MPKKLVNIEIKEVSGVDKAANGKKFLIIKREEDKQMPDTFEGLLEKVEDEEVRKGLLEMYEAREEIEKEEEIEEVAIEKEEIPTEIKKQYEELEKRVEQAEAIAKREREARLEVEFTKQAEKYTHVGETEAIVELLKDASDEYREKLVKVLDGVEERVVKGELFEEIGGNGGEVSGAMDTIDKKIEEIRKVDAGISYEQAFSKVLNEDQALYVAYLEEK